MKETDSKSRDKCIWSQVLAPSSRRMWQLLAHIYKWLWSISTQLRKTAESRLVSGVSQHRGSERPLLKDVEVKPGFHRNPKILEILESWDTDQEQNIVLIYCSKLPHLPPCCNAVNHDNYKTSETVSGLGELWFLALQEVSSLISLSWHQSQVGLVICWPLQEVL